MLFLAGRIFTIIEVIDKYKNLVTGTKTLDISLKDKLVKAKKNYINFFFSDFAIYDSCLSVDKKPLGKLTGDLYRSKFNGELYAKVQLSRVIGTIEGVLYDNEGIWVKMSDLDFATNSSKLPILPILAALFILNT
jgi:hypothetical protein